MSATAATSTSEVDFAPRLHRWKIGVKPPHLTKQQAQPIGVPIEGPCKPEHYRHCARDDATAAEWAFHNAILGVKKQVIAQYGEDSNEIQSLGLTKKSEIVRPGRKAAPAPAKSQT